MTYARDVKLLLIILLACSLCTTAHAGNESITYDPATGSYVYRYLGYTIYEDGRVVNLGLVQGVFTPAKIVPKVQSTLRLDKKWIVNYRYTLINDKTAKHSINHFFLNGLINPPIENFLINTGSTSYRSAVLVPNLWMGVSYEGEIDWKVGFNDLGEPQNQAALPSGGVLNGFGYDSYDLPGIVQAELSGEGEGSGFEDSNGGPAEASPLRAQSDLIHDEDYKPYPIAAPVVVVPKLFDVAVVLENIRTHVATWPNFKTGGYNGNVPPDKKIFLLDAAYATQLDRYLVAATEAFRRNQIKAGKEHLETIHELLEKEHKHLDGDDDSEAEKQDKEHRTATRPNIDRLAARVLDFDLKYVLKRLEGKEEKAVKKKD